MIYFCGILISFAAGFLVIRLLAGKKLNLILHMLLGLALGFGIDGTTAFYIHIILNQFNRFLPVGLVILGILLIAYLTYPKDPKVAPPVKKKKGHKKMSSLPDSRQGIRLPVGALPQGTHLFGGLVALVILAVPLCISAHYYPLGGWDAWSCWSLKAKFIFLGQENWKDVLSPDLWRSNTNYPLLWPLINVWFWDLGGGFDQAVPMLNSIVFATLIAGLLFFGLLELTGNLLSSTVAAVIVTSLPFGVTLYTSQYSDSLLGLFLLSAFLCLLLAEKCGLPGLKTLSMIFLGLMSFTKNEGLVAATIAALLICWRERSNQSGLKKLIPAFVAAALPTVIFTLFICPHNQAFINGLVSTEKPSDWERLKVILIYPLFECISGKWNGLWLFVLGGVLLAGKKLWQSTLGVIGFSLVLYLGAVLAYYEVNTFFKIVWWLSTTLSRILFALVPAIALWVSVGLADSGRRAKAS